jgi:hypothetical protein
MRPKSLGSGAFPLGQSSPVILPLYGAGHRGKHTKKLAASGRIFVILLQRRARSMSGSGAAAARGIEFGAALPTNLVVMFSPKKTIA